MSLMFLNGIGASRGKAARIEKRTAKVEAKGKLKQAKQANRQAIVMKSAPVRILKAVAKQSPVAAQKIKKAAVQAKQRRAFKRAAEPMTIKAEELQAERTYDLPVKVEEGTQEVNEPEFMDDSTGGENDPETMDDLGIIYPDEISGAKRQAKKQAKAPKKAAKKEAKAPKKAARQETAKKVGAGVLAVAKATLEAKGIKFPSKDQIQEQAAAITPEQPKNNYTMPLIIGGGALALFLILKK